MGDLFVKRPQLVLVDHEQPVERDALPRFPLALAQLHVARLQQVMLDQLLHETAGALDVLLELAEETHRIGEQLGIGAVLIEQALAFVRGETLELVIEEHGEVAAFLAFRLLAQHERVTTHEGRNVGVLRPLPLGIDIEVLVLAQAQQRDRAGVGRVGTGEHDHQVACGQAELRTGQRHRVRVHRELHVRDALQAKFLVIGAIERHRVLVENDFSHVDPPCIPRRAGPPPQRPCQTRRRVCIDRGSYQRTRTAATAGMRTDGELVYAAGEQASVALSGGACQALVEGRSTC